MIWEGKRDDRNNKNQEGVEEAVKKKSILALLAFSLSFVLLSSTVVYAVDGIQEDGSDAIEEVQETDTGMDTGQNGDINDRDDPEESQEEPSTESQTSVTQNADDHAGNAALERTGKISGWYLDPADQKWYFYNQQGEKSYGWLKWGNKWYYFDKENAQYPYAMVTDCKIETGGAAYFFDAGGVMVTGWIRRPEGWYYMDENGVMLTGWQKIGGKWYYMDPSDIQNPGLMASNCQRRIGGHTYFFHESGAMLNGWIGRPEGWYYADVNGSMLVGWQKVGGKWYYLDSSNAQNPGLMLSDGRYEINGLTYFFNGSGVMLTNWVRRPEGWYYTDGNGAMLIGWQKIAGKWYYLDPTNDQNPGLMVSNCRCEIGGAVYFFHESGAMLTGWIKDPQGWYYTGGSGAMLTGWQRIAGKWYYLEPANTQNPGLMVFGGWKKIGSLWYFFDKSGGMATGWLKLNGVWYYLGTDGAARTGWKTIDREWYYFYPDTNALAVNTIVDGYKMRSDGTMAGTASTSSRLKWLFPDGLPVVPAQMQAYLTTITVPVVDENGNQSTIALTIHKKLVHEITAVFNELKAIGFPVRKSDTAAYNWRNMASGSSRSHHSYGCVVDLNWNSNPMIGVTAGSYRPGTDPYSVTSKVVQIWKNHGFYWGGDWKSTKDYMHFTYTNH